LIKKRVEQFLEERNFDFNAVCDDYIDVPPVNFESVRSNLQLIREIINSNTSSFGDTSSSTTTSSSSLGDSLGLQESLINPLMETIYERIDEYLRESFAAISDCLGVEPTPKPFEIEKEWERLQELLKNRDSGSGSGSVSPTSASKDKSDWLDALSKDVHYLIEMKRCEVKHQTDRKQQQKEAAATSSPATSPTSTSSSPLTPTSGPGGEGAPYLPTMGGLPSFAVTSQRLAMSHVVPVSGLIMSRFYRLENELKTVLDVWFRNQKDEQTPLISYWS
jgi:hypothetical protein